jgi:hypothetical protein
MELFISHKGSTDELQEGISKIEAKSEVKSIFILACDSNNFTPGNCNLILKSVQKPLFGGVFPSVIYNNDKLDCGTIIIGLDQEASVHIIKNISHCDSNFESSIEQLNEVDFEMKTMAVFVDGFSKQIGSLIEALFIVLGLEYNFIGGGAGSLSMKQKPCIITNEGLLVDCAIIAGLKAECGIGVQHGWESISGPYKVTSSDRNVIKSIDFRPAFEVYKAIVDEHSGKQLTQNNFFDIAKAYPFGINKLGAEKVVRDPLFCENSNLICVGEVPEGSFVDVLHGNKDTLISAAKKAAESSSIGIPEKEKDFILFIDCISRVLFLENNFKDELNVVNYGEIPLVGALTIGEIANNKKDYLDFYNKTAVVASFRKRGRY